MRRRILPHYPTKVYLCDFRLTPQSTLSHCADTFAKTLYKRAAMGGAGDTQKSELLRRWISGSPRVRYQSDDKLRNTMGQHSAILLNVIARPAYGAIS